MLDVSLSTWVPPAVILCWLLVLAVRGRFHTRRRAPGPKPLPLVENLFDIPIDNAWLTFSKWRKSYGDIIHVSTLGNNIVVLNSLQVINDLLDKRRNIYSGRPALHMAGDLMGSGYTMSFSQPTEDWKMCRRFSRTMLNKQAVKIYLPVQKQASLQYLQSLLNEPNEFVPQLRLAVGRVILCAMYGFYPLTPEDPYVSLVEYCLREVTEAAVPGTYLVDLIPALKYVPAWFPGAGFKRKAEHVRLKMNRVIDTPFEQVKRELQAGTASQSYVSQLLQTLESSPETDHNIKWSAGAMYGAGMETTYATVLSFFSLMLEHPEIQRKAQAEIDQLLGAERLPQLEDLVNLPYCEALIKEVNRFCPPVRLGLPHATVVEDEYRGYHIPKNATVIPNIWEISRDTSLYEDPDIFNPERFLGPSPPLDPNTYIFGFGSRSCPGIYLAVNSLNILVVSILAGFNVVFARDEHGKEIPPRVKYTPTLVCVPLPFPCAFEPRPKYAGLIQTARADHTRTY